MKIAVLFGSFNPVTNAHIAAMKAAVAHLGADRGLFVATNGQYLRRKMVKLNDPFCLTEAERRQILEAVCDGEENLSFWGFELGGYTPRRYKTLCRIREQYPDAQIYEIQGADKVHTISKFSDGEDYVSNIRFAVFDRDGIDLQQLLSADALLNRHKDAFTLLPALEAESQISSTEVRRRFYAGEDYSDLVPEAAARVLGQHAPSDFTISFAERMQVMMRSSRFGENNARKVVYEENKKLFLCWKEGTAAVEFGDYRTFLRQTVLYREGYSVEAMGTRYPQTDTGCINMDCVDLARRLIALGYDPAILNLASAKHPGGGYEKGLGAQEESLCRSSNLSVSLYQFGNPKYKHIRESGVPIEKAGYPLDMNFGGIYSPNVTFFRHNKAQFFELMESPFQCDVITAAALSFNGRSDYSGVNELDYRGEDGGFTPEGERIMKNKLRTIFRMGVAHGKDCLVLGAFGCGAYRLPVAEVARLFRQVMEEAEFANKFRLLVFAILESSRKPQGLDGKFAPFYQEFGTYQLPQEQSK